MKKNVVKQAVATPADESTANPPVEIGDYVKLYDHNGLLLHEGILSAAPGSFKPYRDDLWGRWTYFFQNYPNGIAAATPHQVTYSDGSGYYMRAKPFIEVEPKSD